MEHERSPLFYAHAAIDTMMRRYPAAKLPPEGRFHYHQGVFLSGVLKIAAISETERYWQYAADWIHEVFTPDGKIRHYDHADLDDIQPGILLYPLTDHFPEKAPFYRRCLESVEAQIPDIPRCECGGFYHKVRCTRQMWLDGLYMTCPFLAEYARRFHRPDLRDLAVQEILLMRQHTRDPKTGLWRHGWDESRTADWADPKTGLAPEFWGRSIGWVPVAVLDVLDQLPNDDPDRETLTHLVGDLLQSLCKYQSPDGRWYQVIDKGDAPGNWLENSCSCLYASALARCVRLGILEPEYMENATRAFRGVIKDLAWESDDLQIGNVCIGTGIGDYDFYCHRPVCVNDLHGVGTFLLMCEEMQKADE